MHTSVVRAAEQLPPETAWATSPVRIFADDLTGACDAAAPFVRTARAVRVWLGSVAGLFASEPVQAFHTASRNLAPEDAALAVTEAASQLPSAARTLVYKKVDSTLRGPIAAELLALQQTLHASAILLAPAFPAAGRVVRGGVLEVRTRGGQPEARALSEIFPAEMHSQIALVPDADRLASAFASGKSLLLCDSVTQPELDAVARAGQSLAGLLFAGSAGLATALAHLDSQSVPTSSLPRASRVLLIAGSRHPVTALQLERMSAVPESFHPQARLLRIEPAAGAGRQVCDAFTQQQPEAVFFTGGDTAQFAATALGAHSILLRGQFAPGVPWGIAQGGVLHGRIVITKSGGFGPPDLLCDLLKALGRPA